MKTVIAHLSSISVYSQSKQYSVEKIDNGRESHKDYEARTWRNRMHVTDDGHVFIPPMAFKNCLSDVAKYLSLQIPGKGKSTYTKHFEAGVLVCDPLVLPDIASEVAGDWVSVPSDGMRGGGKRVEKCFPIIPKWSGQVRYYLIDEIINESTFRHHLEMAGQVIGIGRFRPRNNGYYGRFKVDEIEWGV